MFHAVSVKTPRIFTVKSLISLIVILAGVLSTAFNEIDYEDPDFTNPATYTLTIALGDTKSDITETIDISFTNQNEPPRFTKDYFDITVTEDVVSDVDF